MTLTYKYLVFPDGDEVEIDHDLRIDQMVDLNGRPLALPLRTARTIAYRVSRIVKRESRGEENRYFYLELIPAADLESFVRR